MLDARQSGGCPFPISVRRNAGPAAFCSARDRDRAVAGRAPGHPQSMVQSFLQHPAGSQLERFRQRRSCFSACWPRSIPCSPSIRLYLNQWLQIRWRRWMTQTYLRQWLDAANHYRMQLLGDAADNPDQRIADDLQMFVRVHADDRYRLAQCGRDALLVRRHSVDAVGTGAAAPVRRDFDIPGYLVWAALIYAVIGTVLTHLIGWRAHSAQFPAAALRGGLPLQSGAHARERRADRRAATAKPRSASGTCHRFGRVVANWLAIMQRPEAAHVFHRRAIRRPP